MGTGAEPDSGGAAQNQAPDGSPAPAASNAGAAVGDVSVDKTVEILGRPAQEYLGKLLDNIGTMLDYMNREGIPMPDELRGKLDALMQDPALEKYSLFPVSRKGTWPWQPAS